MDSRITSTVPKTPLTYGNGALSAAAVIALAAKSAGPSQSELDADERLDCGAVFPTALLATAGGVPMELELFDMAVGGERDQGEDPEFLHIKESVRRPKALPPLDSFWHSINSSSHRSESSDSCGTKNILLPPVARRHRHRHPSRGHSAGNGRSKMEARATGLTWDSISNKAST